MDNASPIADVARLDDIRASVDSICASRGFEAAGRLKTLLRYLVEEELVGRGERIKAYSIGVDVFGKSDSFDPVKDSSVRVAVSNLRQRLDIYYQSDRKTPVVISIPSGGYRPHFVAGKELSAMRRSANKRSLPIEQSRKQRTWQLASASLIAVLILSGIAYWGYGYWKTNQCADARPTVDVSRIAGASETELLSKLQEYLFYYPVMEIILRGEPKCPDVPNFVLNVSPIYEYTGKTWDEAGYIARLTDESGEALKWSKTYHALPNPYYSQGDLVAAQIAYDIGSGTGVIADLATKQHWDNEEAKWRFQCLILMHGYFAGSYPDLPEASSCGDRYWRVSSRADIKALYAASEYERIRGGGLVEGEISTAQKNMTQALEQAQAVSPNDKELMIMRMRLARNADPIDVMAIESLTSQMEKYLSHEPHIMEQIGVTNASYLGNFRKGYGYADRAEYLSGNHGITGWGKVIYYVAMEEWDKLVPLKEYVATDEIPQDQVMALCLARKSGDHLMEQRALRILKQNDLHTVDQYIKHVREEVAPQKIADSLENCLKA